VTKRNLDSTKIRVIAKIFIILFAVFIILVTDMFIITLIYTLLIVIGSILLLSEFYIGLM